MMTGAEAFDMNVGERLEWTHCYLTSANQRETNLSTGVVLILMAGDSSKLNCNVRLQIVMKKKTVMTMKLVKLITIQGQGMKHVQVKLAIVLVVEAEAVVVEEVEVAVEAGVDKVVYLVVVVVIEGDMVKVVEVETGNAAPLKIRQRTKKCATPSLTAKLEANTPTKSWLLRNGLLRTRKVGCVV
jgi:hypothetical protein